ncbi:hypothetical protein BAE44_0011754 [Dichanthelium oligosanthes]|uniref:DUF4220 domain-containing protein n=1 Tax=Dichanthelium oligosanthes TaxID=888268 RepID=A0A1E5VQ56_9POAL|nr:hypothetical protein BAE44_0011754 [Dichanthelium oligosanthes]
MQSIKKLWNEWEIQFLVLLSFTLQFFLFFTGSLRRRNTYMLLNFIIWIAYLGADLVAVYALGFLSRHEDTTTGSDTLRGVHQLAFFWAPFLLIHLGGQDTITAFAIEDNYLWLRHLLNLVVQVTLAIYVFWKSIDQYTYQLTASGIFVSITGIIKYGERTMALMYGNLRDMGSVLQKKKDRSGSNINEDDGSNITENLKEVRRLEQPGVDHLGIVSFALESAPGVRELFAGHTLHQMEYYQRNVLTSTIHKAHMPKLLEVELALMYDDLYTKALVIRTKSGIVLRCLSQISMVVAFVIFLVSDHHGYSRADLAITYVLFSGAFFLEACAAFMLLMSPWTWSWLKARKSCGLAHVCTPILSSSIDRSEGRPLWSNSMGQYNFLSYLGCEKSKLSKLVKRVARMTTILVGANEGKPWLWLSKLLDTEHVKVDRTTMESVIQTVYELHEEGPISLVDAQLWPNIGPFLKDLLPDLGASLGYGIVCFHIFTELHLRSYQYEIYPPHHVSHLITACRNLSNYMLYLLVTRPEMLPVSGTIGPTLKLFLDSIAKEDWHRQSLSTQLGRATDLLMNLGIYNQPMASRATLQEVMSVWTRLLVYSAGKSRAAVHAAGLSTGGELITFAWLLMAHNQLGDVGQRYAFILEDVVRQPLPVDSRRRLQRLNAFKGTFALNLA